MLCPLPAAHHGWCATVALCRQPLFLPQRWPRIWPAALARESDSCPRYQDSVQDHLMTHPEASVVVTGQRKAAQAGAGGCHNVGCTSGQQQHAQRLSYRLDLQLLTDLCHS